MTAAQVPFIDFAVHDRVRSRLARGAATVLFAPALDRVLWANGSGAHLLGFRSVNDAVGGEPNLSAAVLRQIAAAGKVAAALHGPVRSFTLRAASGFRGRLLSARMEQVILAGGERALLLTTNDNGAVDAGTGDAGTIARNVLDGFEDDETAAAVTDEDGGVVAGTRAFAALEIDTVAVRRMAQDAGGQDRLAKQPLATTRGRMPAAMARIVDAPVLHLLLVAESPSPDGRSADPGGTEKAGKSDQRVYPSQAPFAFDPKRHPARFVWKIGADGVFEEISGEFAEMAGPNAADVKGRKFVDVARVFNIDPDRVIADLLQQRETWSGKTVFWPIQGTDLRVPVDLAGLPTYSRDRVFDGFRGFGIVRPGDAVRDPDAIGLALVRNAFEETGKTGTGRAGTGEAANSVGLSADKPAARCRRSKVVRLEKRASGKREELTRSERRSLREIAERLGAVERREDPAEGARSDDEPVVAADRSRETGGTDKRRNGPVKSFGNRVPPPRRRGVLTLPATTKPLEVAHVTPGKTGPVPDGSGALTPAILEQLPVALVVHEGAAVLHVNEAFRQMTGHLTVSRLNEVGGVAALFDAEIDPAGGEAGVRTANGETITVLVQPRAVRWRDMQARVLALQASGLPVAGAVRGEAGGRAGDEAAAPPRPDAQVAALEVEIDELRSILETATDGVVLLGADGVIRSMNRSASALFDYDEKETVGRPFAMLFAHESQRAIRDYLAGLTENGVATVLNDGREVIGREASGGFLPLFMTIGRLSGSNGYCAVMRDITQWKRAEDELRTAKRAAETASSHKSAFLARVSHEIRTPLNAIIGFAELMSNERFSRFASPRYIEYADDIGRSGRHVLEIVNDLLDISKIEAGEQELDFATVSLNDILREAIGILQPQARAQQVIVRASLSSSLPDVMADRRTVKQIVINILSNAIRFTPARGQVVASTTCQPDGAVSVRIRDTGAGMTRQQLEQAMEPFRQIADARDRKRGDGTGLGLPLAKAMAEANRARFAMNSKPGEGTLVEIAFPASRVVAE